MRMLGNGSMGSRRRYLAEQEVFMAELFAKAEGFKPPALPKARNTLFNRARWAMDYDDEHTIRQLLPQVESRGTRTARSLARSMRSYLNQDVGKAEGFTTPITKPTASFKAPGMSAGGAIAKPKAALKPTGGKLPTSSERLATLKQNMADKIGQTGTSTGAPTAVGTVGKKLTWDAVGRFVEGANPYSWDAVPEGLAGKAGATTSLGLGTGTALHAIRQARKESKERQEKLRRRGKFQKTKPSTVVKVLRETGRAPGKIFYVMGGSGASRKGHVTPTDFVHNDIFGSGIKGRKGYTAPDADERIKSKLKAGKGGMRQTSDTSHGWIGMGKREPLKTSISDDDARKVIGRYGLKGPLPKELDREQKMAAYEARYVSAGGKKAEKWDQRARTADKVKTGGLAVATAGGAAWLASRSKLGAKIKVSPRLREAADNVAVGGAVAGGAGELYAGHARRKRSSYASAPAGVAASALRRMRDYTKDA